jgi:hypothetical protein
MKTIREIIIERLIHNFRATNPTEDEMRDYFLEIQQSTDYDLLDDFELMLTE